MEVAISSELKGKDISQLQELFIDGTSHNSIDNSHISDETKRLLEQCVALESLSIVNWRLASLKNFPHLPNLKKLVLSHNSLRDGLQHLVEAKLNLLCLNLTHNLISKVSELLCLGLFENLQTLELVGCSVCKAPDVSATIFKIIPSLKALDIVYISKSEAEDSDPFNTPHANNNTHHSANNNGINGTHRPPPQHGKLFNMSQLLKDYNETFSLYYSNYSSSNSYGQHEFSASDLEHLLSDIQPAIPQAPPPPPSPKVREMADTQPPAETESTDDEGEAEDESFDENHDEDLETLQRIAQGMLRQERPTRRAAQPQSRAEYQARQAQMALFEDDDDEDEDDDDFNPDQDSDRGEGSQSSSEEPAQDDRGQREASEEEGSEEEAPPSPTSHTSGGSSGSKRERDPNADDDAESTQPKKQR